MVEETDRCPACGISKKDWSIPDPENPNKSKCKGCGTIYHDPNRVA